MLHRKRHRDAWSGSNCVLFHASRLDRRPRLDDVRDRPEWISGKYDGTPCHVHLGRDGHTSNRVRP